MVLATRMIQGNPAMSTVRSNMDLRVLVMAEMSTCPVTAMMTYICVNNVDSRKTLLAVEIVIVVQTPVIHVQEACISIVCALGTEM